MASPLRKRTVLRRLLAAASGDASARAEALAAVARLPDVNDVPSTGVTLLMGMARLHNVWAVKALLAAGANPNAPDCVAGVPAAMASGTPLQYVFQQGFPRRSLDASARREVLRCLLDAGADPRVPGLWHAVCGEGPAAALLFLDEVPGLPAAACPFEDALAHSLVEPSPSWRDVFLVLLGRGADPFLRLEGRTPMERALAASARLGFADEAAGADAIRTWDEIVHAASLSRSLDPAPPSRPFRL